MNSTIHSYLRGRRIFFSSEEKQWFYSDNGEPTANNPRSCGHCNLPDREDGHDACIGELPGVMNACCGHGRTDGAYVQFQDGKCLREKDAVLYINWATSGEPDV